ncbi:hypothetical protein [Streptococcus equi]|uniref:hypothetical protein n=1 Tax=Streptococcus equi TaxID=1336 RepID=UPI001E5405EC|nr:hypothetical protein [Streptococcus equi]
MDDAEQDFLRQKKGYQKREDSLSERRHVLDDLINSEYQKMSVFLKRLDLSANAASDFFKELDRLRINPTQSFTSSGQLLKRSEHSQPRLFVKSRIKERQSY